MNSTNYQIIENKNAKINVSETEKDGVIFLKVDWHSDKQIIPYRAKITRWSTVWVKHCLRANLTQIFSKSVLLFLPRYLFLNLKSVEANQMLQRFF